MATSGDPNIQVIACLNDVLDIVSAPREEPQIVLLDFSVVSETLYAILTALRRCHPNALVVFLCFDVDQAKLINAFRFGAFGYLEAKTNDVFLTKSVHAVSGGEAWVPRQFTTKIVERLRHPPPPT